MELENDGYLNQNICSSPQTVHIGQINTNSRTDSISSPIDDKYTTKILDDNHQSNHQFFLRSNQDQSFQKGHYIELKVEVKKEKRIKKNRQQLKEIQKKFRVVSIQDKLSSLDDTIRFFQGLSISRDGIIRFQFSVAQVCFGFNTQDTQSVSYLKEAELVSINRSYTSQPNKISLEEALKFLARTPCKMYDEASSALREFSKLKENINSRLFTLKIDKALINQKDEEMSRFIELSFKFVQEYSYKYVSEIFTFGIGRINLSKKDLEIKNGGYSKSFLDLIGIDIENFSSILLRQQRIDLVQNKDEILKQSIYGMNQRLLSGEVISMTYNIVTFDGFPLKIQTNKKTHKPPGFQYQQLFDIPCEYVLTLTTVDVDLQELQNLIQYRERLLSGQNSLSFEDFIKKELSFLFENVEYSVHSQMFIEKYYKQNLINLQKLQQQKIKDEIESRKAPKKQCNYSLISNTTSWNPIEIININS